MTPSRRHRGIALVVVLWVLVLLSVVAAGFLSDSRTGIRIARNLMQAAQAEALADIGVHLAILQLMKPVASGGWRVDGTVYGWQADGGEIRVSIADEGAKIDLNASQDNLLRGLFVSVGLEEDQAAELVDAMLDFRDKDDLRRLNGAEDQDYSAAGLPYDAKDAPFEAIEELRQVYGMTAALYQAVAPALTVHSRRRRPYSATSPPEVRAALDSVLGQAPEEPDAAPEPEQTELEPEGVARILSEGPSTARSRVPVYTIHAEGRSADNALFVREALVQVTRSPNRPYQVHRWRRGTRKLFETAVPELE